MPRDFSQQSILFSANKHGEVKHRDSIAILANQAGINHLITLAQQHGNLTIAKHPEGIKIKIGPYIFRVILRTNRSIIIFEDVVELSATMAELFLTISGIVFPHRQDNFKISSGNLVSEFALWKEAREMSIPLWPADAIQTSRFNAWDQTAKAALRNHSSFFQPEDVVQAQQKQQSTTVLNSPTKLPHSIALFLDHGTICPLADLIYEYGELGLTLNNGMWILHIHERHLSIVVEHSRVTINLLDVDLSRPGAAEMIAKILDAFYFDRERRLRLNIHEEDALQAIFGILHEKGISIDTDDPKQAKLLEKFAEAWASGDKKAASSFFSVIEEQHNNNPDNEPKPN